MGFVAIEAWGKRAFEQFPFIKHSAKRMYHLVSYALSKDKFKSEGNVIRITPDDGFEYFYGYYDFSFFTPFFLLISSNPKKVFSK